MDEDDWREIVQLIQDELREVGQEDIADLSNYEVREGAERFLPEPRHLVKEMLDALRRDMAARSSTTAQKSLRRLSQLIDEGERPKEAVVLVDPDRSLVEGRETRERLDGTPNVSEADEDLEQLIYQLAEIGFGGDLQ